MFRCVARIAAAAVCAALLCVPAAQAQVQPYGTSDYGGFRNVLPPGTNGFDDAAQLVQFEATGARPAHSDDQLAMYSNLTTAAGSITIQFRAIGTITQPLIPWVNRPTFQQADEIQGHGPG
ncbi:MAG: hypothetical protein ACXVR1_04595 [Solirubrobacteraceae bacterium]